jgi:hypothetical protein
MRNVGLSFPKEKYVSNGVFRGNNFVVILSNKPRWYLLYTYGPDGLTNTIFWSIHSWMIWATIPSSLQVRQCLFFRRYAWKWSWKATKKSMEIPRCTRKTCSVDYCVNIEI